MLVRAEARRSEACWGKLGNAGGCWSVLGRARACWGVLMLDEPCQGVLGRAGACWGVLRHAESCRSVLKRVEACCGALAHAVACWACWHVLCVLRVLCMSCWNMLGHARACWRVVGAYYGVLDALVCCVGVFSGVLRRGKARAYWAVSSRIAPCQGVLERCMLVELLKRA